MKPDFKPEAIKHAKLIYPCDGSTRHIVAAADFEMGADHGYSLAMEQHRDFYLIVRRFVFLTDTAIMHTPESEELCQLDKQIRQHLTAFTSRELESLPFKD